MTAGIIVCVIAVIVVAVVLNEEYRAKGKRDETDR